MRKICDGIIVDKDGIEIEDHKLTDMFVRLYWNAIRDRIKNGEIDRGELTWDDTCCILNVMDIYYGDSNHSFSIPDDIIGAFAEKGYGTFYPNDRVDLSTKI